MENCNGIISETQCEPKYKNKKCSGGFHICLIETMRRECQISDPNELYTLCLLSAYRRGEICNYGSICSHAFRDREMFVSGAGKKVGRILLFVVIGVIGLVFL